MTDAVLDTLLPHLRRLVTRHDAAALSDGQLVERFHRHAEQEAFAELVRRHGPMVLGVCRAALRNHHDAEDAFQATFLVLARKAGSLRRPGAVAGYLYRVAAHVAARAAGRGPSRPHPLPEPETADMTAGDPLLDLTVRELRQAIHEELQRLPERYRLPLLLCYLEGRTQNEAARELGWSEGAFRGRLIRGRGQLRARLTRRGLALSAGVATLGLASGASVPPTLLGETVQAGLRFREGTAAVPAKAAALAGGTLRALSVGRLKAGGTCLLMAGLLTVATGALARQGQPQAPAPAGGGQAQQVRAPKREGNPAARVDAFGDPLPDGAVSRLGTLRFRHGEGVSFVRFTPDGKVLVSEGGEGVRTWEVTTGKQIHCLPRETTYGGYGADLSPDGQQLVSVTDSGLRLSAVTTGRRGRTLGAGRYCHPCFSPDGKTVAVLGPGPPARVELWEVDTGGQVWSVSPGNDPLDSLAFAPDGKTVVVVGWGVLQIPPRKDNTLRYLDAATGKEFRRIDLGSDTPRQVAFSPDGSRFAVLAFAWNGKGFSGAVRVWETASGKELPQPGAPAAEGAGRDRLLSAMTFTPDGRTLVTSGGQESLIVWDVATGKERRRLGRGLTAAQALAFSPDGKAVAVGSPGAWIRVIDWASGEDLGPVGRNSWGAYRTALTPDGRTVVTASAGPSFVLWDALTGREQRRLEVGGPLADYSLADDGRKAMSLRTSDRTLRRWDLDAAKEGPPVPLAFVGGQPGVKAIGPGGKVVAVGTYDKDTVFLVDVATGKVLNRLQDAGRKVRHAAFTADGSTLVTFCDDRTARVWDATRGTKRLRLGPMGDGRLSPVGLAAPAGSSAAYAAALSPDGRWVAYGSQGGELLLYEVATGQEVRRLDELPTGAGLFTFSPDSRMLAWGGWRDPVVHILEVASGKERRALSGHRGRLCSLAFSADSKTLVSGSVDTTALVWDLAGRAPVADLGACWAALEGADAAAAFEALRKLAASPDRAVPYLRDRLHPVPAADEKHLAGLLADLYSGQFEVRERAAQELDRLGDVAMPACRVALAGQPSPEVRRRLDAFLERQSQDRRTPSPATLRMLRALEVLEWAATPDARRLLDALARGAPAARLTQEAKAIRERLARRPAPEP